MKGNQSALKQGVTPATGGTLSRRAFVRTVGAGGLLLAAPDLCYANISPDRPKTWRDFFLENEVSARFRPWMPAAGNHENELGNGPLGFRAYQTRFSLPDHGESEPAFRGLWYTFKAGSVRVISLNNDDVCIQDGGDSYVHGYSQGAQKSWLEKSWRYWRPRRP